MSDYSRGDWKHYYQIVNDGLGPGMSKDQMKMLRVLFMKAEDEILGLRKSKKSVGQRMKDPMYSRRGSFH